MNTQKNKIGRLIIAMLYLDKAKNALDAAATLTPELREEIESPALEIRKIFDKMDTIICTHTSTSK